MAKAKSDRIAVVTIHGTGDTAEGPDGDKWFQRGSAFATRLLQQLAGKGVEADIVPHLWSGANSATHREKGAQSLSKLVRQLSRTHRGVHLVGHSHGGNVANDAACMLGWSGRQRRPKIASLATVGAPYFRTQIKGRERLVAWAFTIIVTLSVLVCLYNLNGALSGVAGAEKKLSEVQTSAEADDKFLRRHVDRLKELERISSRSLTSEEATEKVELQLVLLRNGRHQRNNIRAANEKRDRERSRAQLLSYFTFGSVFALLFVMPIAVQGVRRIGRAGRKRESGLLVLALWHPNDEAIAFLQRVETLPVEPFPRGALLRGSRTVGISLGVLAVSLVPLIGLVTLAACKALAPAYDVIANPDYGLVREGNPYPLALPPTLDFLPSIVETGRNAVLLGLAGAPLIFAVVYVAYRLFMAVVGEFGLRGGLNNAVGGALKGIAFGRDGDNRIGDVAPTSHYFASKQVVLDGDVASRMLAASTVATQKLFNKYRSSLFSVGTESSNAVAELTTDAMTWDSLIHTTYFDQPEVADVLAEHIATEARAAS